MPRGRPIDANRAAALQEGTRHYEGAPCSHGHTKRHARSRACVECQADGQRRRRAIVADDFESLLGD